MNASIVDTFNGLPLHPLVVHAAVVLTPIAALMALSLVRPSWRSRMRWPVAWAALAAWLLVWLARASGEALEAAIRPQLKAAPDFAKVVEAHAELADRLNAVLFTLVVVTLLFAWLQPKLPRGAAAVGAVAIVVLAVLVVGVTAMTGEAGARAVWNPTGSQDYAIR